MQGKLSNQRNLNIFIVKTKILLMYMQPFLKMQSTMILMKKISQIQMNEYRYGHQINVLRRRTNTVILRMKAILDEIRGTVN